METNKSPYLKTQVGLTNTRELELGVYYRTAIPMGGASTWSQSQTQEHMVLQSHLGS